MEKDIFKLLVLLLILFTQISLLYDSIINGVNINNTSFVVLLLIGTVLINKEDR